MTFDPARRGIRGVLGILLTLLCGGSGTRGEDTPRERVTLLPLWLPQAQFTGYYIATEKGFYARRGLEVEVLRGGPEHDVVKELEKGEADFAVVWLAQALFALDRGVALSHVAQVFSTSNLEIVAWRKKGVTSLRDLDGRRVSIWGDSLRPPFEAFFRSQSLKPVIIPQHATVNLFLLGGVDACSVMEYNEYNSIYLAGVDESELVRFPLRSHGVDFPEDGLYCLRRTREARPHVAKALAEASLEGWKYAAEHLEEALDSVMQRTREANLPINRAHMRWMLRVVLRSVFPDGVRPPTSSDPKPGPERAPGALSRRAYDETVRRLLELGALKTAPTYEEFTR